MPHASITLLAGRSPEVKERAAREVRKVLARELSVKEDLISVSVEDIESSDWKDHIAKFQDTMLISPSYLKAKEEEPALAAVPASKPAEAKKEVSLVKKSIVQATLYKAGQTENKPAYVCSGLKAS